MATFKAVVRGERKDGFMQVYIRVSHKKRHGYIKTDKMVTRKEVGKSEEIKDTLVMNYTPLRLMNVSMTRTAVSIMRDRYISSNYSKMR